MATYSRVTPAGWEQGDDSSAVSRVAPDGWEQAASGALAGINGTASITLGALTVTAAGTGTSASQGAASITLDALTTTATGSLAIAGTASITLGALTLTATGGNVRATPRTGMVHVLDFTGTSGSKSIYVPPNQENGIVLISAHWHGTASLTSVTLNGVSAHAIDTASTGSTSTNARSVQWFYLLNSELGASGAMTLSATLSASAQTLIVAHQYDGVDQTTPYGTVAKATAGGSAHTSIGVNVDTYSGGVALVALCGDKNPTADAGQTVVQELLRTSTYEATSSADGTGSPVAMGYTYASTTVGAALQAICLQGQQGEAPAILAPTATGNRSMVIAGGLQNVIDAGSNAGINFPGASLEESPTTGLNTQTPWPYAGTFRNLRIYVSPNTLSGDAAVVWQHDQVDQAFSLTVTAATVGAFGSSVGAEIHTDGTHNIGLDVRPAAGTGSASFVSASVEFEPDNAADTVTLLHVYTAGDSSFILTPSQGMTGFHVPYGTRTVSNGTEAAAAVPAPITGTVENAFAELYGISAGLQITTTAHMGLRVNGADGNASWAQSPVGTDQITAFAPGTDDIVVGDLLDWTVRLNPAEPSGKNFGYEVIGGWLRNAQGYSWLMSGCANGAGTISGGTTRYINAAGEQRVSATVADVATVASYSFTAFRFYVQVRTNVLTGGTGGIRFYFVVNGTRTALQIDVPRSSGDVYYLEPYQQVMVAQGDEFYYEADATDAGSGSFRVPAIGIVAATVITSATATRSIGLQRTGTATFAHAAAPVAAAASRSISLQRTGTATVAHAGAPVVADSSRSINLRRSAAGVIMNTAVTPAVLTAPPAGRRGANMLRRQPNLTSGQR